MRCKEHVEKNLWECEFGEGYRPEPEVLSLLDAHGVDDQSWHNDTCPHFVADAGDGQEVYLWFEHSNPREREYWDENADESWAHRYYIVLVDKEDYNFHDESAVTTDDPLVAAFTFARLAKLDRANALGAELEARKNK